MTNREEPNLEKLIKRLEENNPQTRLATIKALGQSGDPGAIAPLSKLLENGAEPRVRMRVVGALGQLANDKAVELLCHVLTRDEDPDVRGRAARALGEIASPTAIGTLDQALQDENAEVRRRAILALNQISDPATLKPLLNALSDPDRDVRRFAARALGQLGDPAALEPLKQLRTDSNLVVQNEAVQAIRVIQDQQSLQAQINKVEQLREQRSQAIGGTFDQVQLDGQIDLEQLAVYRLEASVAANKVALPSEEEVGEQDRERQSIIYELQRLTRELESLSTSVRAARLREAWELQLHEVQDILAVWSDSKIEPDLEDMRAELKRLQQRKEERFDTQDKELIELTRFIQEGYSNQLQIEQIHDTLSDPSNQTKVKNWRHAAGAEYNLLKIAREKGDYPVAKEHHANIAELYEQCEKLKNQENKAKIATGKSVILFIVVSMLGLTAILYILSWRGLANDKIPTLEVPYAVVAWSAIGSVAAMLYQFLNRPVSQLETFKWLIARPIQGIIMGSFLYLVVAGGLLIIGSQTDIEIRSEMAAAIAFLGGFSDRFADAMVKRATSILTRDSSDKLKEDS